MTSSWLACLATLLCSLIFGTVTNGQIFSSMGELANVFKMEVELVSVLQRHRDTLETSLNQIKNYAQEVKAMYEKEDCWPVKEKCTDQNLMDKIVGNPIYNYQVLKRLNVVFKKVEEAAKAVDTKSKCAFIRCWGLIFCLREYWSARSMVDLEVRAEALQFLVLENR